MICNMDCLNCKYEDCININDVLNFEVKIKNEPTSESHERWHNEYMVKKTRALETGMCKICNRNPRKENSLICEECSKKNYQRELKNKEQGLCKCGNPIANGKKTCDICLKASRNSMQKIYYERRKQGLCVKCGAPVDKGTLCATCEEKNRISKAKHKKAVVDGICKCGNPTIDGKKTCEECLAKKRVHRKNRYERLKSQHLCTHCGKVFVENRTICSKCALKVNQALRKQESEKVGVSNE